MVEYLGHIVSHEGVKVDPSKIKSIKEWKIPTSIKHLRGFLRLAGYYRKFVKNYGRIVAPLTTLLKRDAFSWTLEATKAFEHLKETMSQAPVLVTPCYSEKCLCKTANPTKAGSYLRNKQSKNTFVFLYERYMREE